MSSNRRSKIKDLINSAGMDMQNAAQQQTSLSAPPSQDTPLSSTRRSSHPEYLRLPIDKVRPNPKQPRQKLNEADLADLAQSIKKVGVLQPIVITPPDSDDIHTLIAGHRRWRAAQMAGLTEIPAVVQESEEIGKLALIENLQRSNLKPIEEALALSDLRDDLEFTQERLSAELGKSQSWVAETLSLLRLPEPIRLELIEGVEQQSVSKSALIEMARMGSDEEILSTWQRLKEAGDTTVRSARAEKQTPRKARSSQLQRFEYESKLFRECVDKLMKRKLEELHKSQLRQELQDLREYIDLRLQEF
jgi:ParB/RepB/Spo0J family partition protein